MSGPFACERRLALRKTSALALHWCIAARAWHPVFISWNSKLVLNLLRWCCQPGAPCLPTIGNRSAPIATRAVGGQNAKSKERRGRCNGALLHPYLVDRRLGVPFGCVCSFCCPLSVSFLIRNPSVGVSDVVSCFRFRPSSSGYRRRHTCVHSTDARVAHSKAVPPCKTPPRIGGRKMWITLTGPRLSAER